MEKDTKSLSKDNQKTFLEKAKEKVVQSIDRNGDGTLDMADVSILATSVGNSVKKGTAAIKENAEANRKRRDEKSLRPIFPDTVQRSDFALTKLLRIADRDKKHADSDVCQGSIGFVQETGKTAFITLFKDSLNNFGLSFYPDDDCEFYYANPTDKNHYIALNEYFGYMKTVRINELQRVAQELGAVHFKVVNKEEVFSFSKSKKSARFTAPSVKNGNYESNISENKNAAVDVAAEMNMVGHPPKMPQLVYLLKDESVQNLIHLRMTGGDDFRNHKISIRMSNSSGMKESDAVNIDAALKALKFSGKITVESEAKHESQSYLEYEIDF